MQVSNPSLLVLPEHGRFRIGRAWDPNQATIGEADAATLGRVLDRVPIPPIHLGRNGGSATQWVGTLAFGSHAIEVVPKIDCLGAPQVRENLLWMLQIAGLVPVAPGDIARIAHSGKPLLVSFLALYLREFGRELRRGLPRRYVEIEDNRACLRGKLVMAGHLRRNLVSQQRFLTRNDEFTPDNPVMWLLKAAARVCARQQLDAGVALDAMALLSDLDEVSDVDPRVLASIEPHLDRTLERFRALLQLARLILQQASPERQETTRTTYSLLFDMNVVFERFITEALRQALAGSGISVRGQVTGRYLLRETGRGRFGLRPDISLFKSGQTQALIDAKWKRLFPEKPNCGISQADMYQAYAYGKEYQVPQTILVYPRWGSLSETPKDYTHGSSGAGEERFRIGIRTLNISRPLGSPPERAALFEDLRRLALDAVSHTRTDGGQ